MLFGVTARQSPVVPVYPYCTFGGVWIKANIAGVCQRRYSEEHDRHQHSTHIHLELSSAVNPSTGYLHLANRAKTSAQT
jgi:hypothetical protein